MSSGTNSQPDSANTPVSNASAAGTKAGTDEDEERGARRRDAQPTEPFAGRASGKIAVTGLITTSSKGEVLIFDDEKRGAAGDDDNDDDTSNGDLGSAKCAVTNNGQSDEDERRHSSVIPSFLGQAKMKMRNAGIKVAKKIRTNNGLHDTADEMMVVKLSDFDALKMKLEELEVSQRNQRAEIEASQRAEMERQKREVLQRAEMEAQKREMEAQKREMKAQKEDMERLEMLQRAQREEIEAQKQRIQDLEASHEEDRDLIPVEIPHGADNSSPTHEMSGTAATGLGQTFLRRRMSSMFRNYHIVSNSGGGGDDENGDALESDTFSLMMISKVWSRSWALGMVAFLFQIVLGAMIASDQLSLSTDSSHFDVPFKVKAVVRVGQFLTIILCLSTQSDILTSVQSVLLLGKGSNWDEVIGETGHKSTCLWIIRILVPNLLKCTQGCLVTYVSFVIIVQSYDIIDLLKDFTALMVLSETDNILFDLAGYGYLGKELMDQAAKVSEMKVPEEPSATTDTNPASLPPTTGRCRKFHSPFCIRYLVLLSPFLLMLGGWLTIVQNQISGKYFYMKYPDCNFTDQDLDAFKLAKEHFGDDTCYGGPLNSLECAFEGGDCIDFNLAYPLCKGNDLLNVQIKIGNNECDPEFNTAVCGFDGNDCGFETRYPHCPHIDLAMKHFGDGICYGGPLNTLDCEFEGGDCIGFNIEYPLCKGRDDLINVQSSVGNGTCEELFMIPECDFDGGDCCPYINSPLFGDNQCHGGTFNTARCGFDNGDCNIFNAAYPKCPLAELGDIEGAEDFVLGDDVCDGVYSSAECGWENGDCDVGQIGQDLIADFTNDDLTSVTLVVGRKRTMGIFSDRIASVYHYNDLKKRWNPVGNLPTRDGEATLTLAMSMNHAGGDRIAITSVPFEEGWVDWQSSQVKVYDYVALNQTWAQVGQNINGEEQIFSFGYRIDMTANGARLVISAPGAFDYYAGGIFIYELNMAENRWDLVGNIIEGKGDMEVIGGYFIHISSDNGNTVIFSSGSFDYPDNVMTRIYRYDQDSQDWMQLGSDMPSPYGESSAISSNGTRIAVSSNAFNEDAPGEVKIYDFDEIDNLWIQIGRTIISARSSDGDGFGYDIAMSSDGNILTISSVDQKCDNCASGSVQIYVFNSDRNMFVPVDARLHQNGNMILDRDRETDDTQFGLSLSMSGDGSTLSIMGYNFVDKQHFVRVYDLDLLFYSRCLVDHPDWLGNGFCYDEYPYNSAECHFDGGDCPLPTPVEYYLDCMVSYPEKIGDGECHDANLAMYNTTECGYEGGDCFPKPVDGYPGCFVLHPYHVGDRECDSWDNYNTTECGYDGGDCLPKPVDGYPGCFVLYPYHVGDGECDSWDNYNTTECGYDGGDCLPKPVDGYPGCFVLHPYHVGDGECDSWDNYNTVECGYDGGDCLPKPVDGYPGCLVPDTYRIGDGECDSQRDPSYNTTKCGYDGGDCLP